VHGIGCIGCIGIASAASAALALHPYVLGGQLMHVV
jgi:hypothetical protein